MAHPSKRKGSRFERELREQFREAGLRCKRAWASDGTTLTDCAGQRCASDVDLLVEERLAIQAKRRKRIANYLTPPPGAHATIVREDRSTALAVLPLPLFLKLLQRVYESTETSVK